MKRLPRVVKIGHYRIDVLLVSLSVLRDELDDEDGGLYQGCWIPDLENDRSHGRIMILQDQPLNKKWEAFWHELYHAVTDLSGWDGELRQIP